MAEAHPRMLNGEIIVYQNDTHTHTIIFSSDGPDTSIEVEKTGGISNFIIVLVSALVVIISITVMLIFREEIKARLRK